MKVLLTDRYLNLSLCHGKILFTVYAQSLQRKTLVAAYRSHYEHQSKSTCTTAQNILRSHTVASMQNARRCVSISLRTPEQIHLQRSTEHSQITMSPQYITKYRPEFRTRKHKYHRIQNAKNASKVKFPVQLQNK